MNIYTQKSIYNNNNLTASKAFVGLDENNFIAAKIDYLDGQHTLSVFPVFISNIGVISTGNYYVIDSGSYAQHDIRNIQLEKISSTKAMLTYYNDDSVNLYGSGMAACLELSNNNIYSSGRLYIDKTGITAQGDVGFFSTALDENTGIIFYESSGSDNRLWAKSFEVINSGFQIRDTKTIKEDILSGWSLKYAIPITSKSAIFSYYSAFRPGANSAFRFVEIDNYILSTGEDVGFAYINNFGFAKNSGECYIYSVISENQYGFAKISIDADNESISVDDTYEDITSHYTATNVQMEQINSTNLIKIWTADASYVGLTKYEIGATGVSVVSSGAFDNYSNFEMYPKDLGNIPVYAGSYIYLYSDSILATGDIGVFSYGLSTNGEEKDGINFSSTITYVNFNPIYGGQYDSQISYDRVYGDVENNSGTYTIKFFADNNRLYEIARYSSVSASGNLINVQGSGVGDGLNLTFSYGIT